MPFYEREDKILQILAEKKTIGNQELARLLFISLPTLRRDLEKLESKGLIVRSHGACSLNRQIADEKIPFYYREQRQSAEKHQMARKALRYIKDGDVLMLDASGAGLHKRGYRAQGVAAPLRETLAAAMVLLSRYRGRDPLCDPFCGSGTIPIEAALIAKNRAPGLNRTFSAQKWSWLDKKLWMEAADEAMDREFHGDYEIWGGDLDPEAVALARHNAQLAEVDDVVRFDVDDARTFHWGGLYGRVVTNPPYGERIMERKEAEELYRAFGRAWSKFPEGWKLYLLSSHTEFERTFGKKADKKRKLYNGMLKCDLFMYL